MADHQLWLPSEAAGEGQRPDRGSDAADHVDRPSFTDYWKWEKESERAGKVQFVTEGQPLSSPATMGPPPRPQQQGSSVVDDELGPSKYKALTPFPAESPTAADKSKEKAKLRRQQVRKAQIQHRTRKANYIKQLELDVCKFRDMIAAAEKEVLAYQRQNEGMRGALSARGLRVPEELKGKEREMPVGEVRILEEQSVEEVPVHHEHHEAYIHEQQQPLPEYLDYRIESESQQEMVQPELPVVHQQEPIEYDPYPPVDLFGDVNVGDITVTMRKDETLGTPCFQISSSSSNSPSPPAPPATPDQLSPEQEIIAINLILAMEHICWNHFHPRQFPRHGDVCKAASGHTMMASTMCMSSAPERVYRSIRRREVETPQTWQASTGAGSALSLKSLLSLARALNPGDIELTPVQAWFELAARYGAAALLEDRVIEALKREFCGVVDCIHFGAIIERDAFESVVARVMAEAGVPELPWEMDVDVGVCAAAGIDVMAGAGRVAA